MQANIHDELTAKMAGLIRGAVEKMEMMARELIDYSRGNTQLNLQSLTVNDFLRYLEPDFAKCRPGIDVRIEVLLALPRPVEVPDQSRGPLSAEHLPDHRRRLRTASAAASKRSTLRKLSAAYGRRSAERCPVAFSFATA